MSTISTGKPYTEEERTKKRKNWYPIDGRSPFTDRMMADSVRRYEATVAQVEAERDAAVARVEELEKELSEAKWKMAP